MGIGTATGQSSGRRAQPQGNLPEREKPHTKLREDKESGSEKSKGCGQPLLKTVVSHYLEKLDLLKFTASRAGEMAHCLRMLPAFVEELSSVHRAQGGYHNHL